MAVRTKDEILEATARILGDRTDDEAVAFLEDISDSLTSELDMNEFVTRSEYESAVAERDAARADAESMRSRYINRFYGKPDKGEAREIEGEAAESDIIEAEEKISYEDLFE